MNDSLRQLGAMITRSVRPVKRGGGFYMMSQLGQEELDFLNVEVMSKNTSHQYLLNKI